MTSSHSAHFPRICEDNRESPPSTIPWYDKIYSPSLVSTVSNTEIWMRYRPILSPRLSSEAGLILPLQPLASLSLSSTGPAPSGPTVTAGIPPSTSSVMEHPTVVPQSRREDESLPKDLETYVPRTIRDPQAAVHILFLLQNFHRLDSKEEITQLLETVPYLQKGDGEKWWKENRGQFISMCQVLARSSVNFTPENPSANTVLSTSFGPGTSQPSVNASKVQLLDNLFTTLVVAMGRRKTPSPPHIEQTSLKSIATSLAHMNPDQRDPYKLMSILLELLALNKEDKISVEELVSETLGFPQREPQQSTQPAIKHSSSSPPSSSSVSTRLHVRSTSPSSTQKSTQASKSHARVKSPPSASLTSITSNASVIHSERLKNSWILRSTQTKGNARIPYTYWQKDVSDVDKFEEPDSEHEAFKTTYVVVLESKESTSGEKNWSIWYNLKPANDDSEWARAYINKRWFAEARIPLPGSPEEGKKYLSWESRGSLGNRYLVPTWIVDDTRRQHEKNTTFPLPKNDEPYDFTW
ncbi:hypothetical protein K435DRAFT_878319 [Dendrothele bispora CBS 962.96]|uniref:Uncharacterized protein n=1 Tax=Dendrothele bispora (strain CBS 962.96) TaxID=1314807 RepID=A0A4S8KN85_DENBC|nr:hypothetical protein K435DRAFT_878319 [Dendrothele bispora CBS 962.96]